MTRDYVQLVREGYEAWNAGDRQWVLDHMTPDVEWISPPEDPEPGTYHGHAGVEKFWEQWRAAVGQLRFDVEKIEQRGDHVIVDARRSGTGAHSGLQVSDAVIQVFTFNENGKCVMVREFYDRAKALQATGAGAVEAESA